jgi:hypothetical protein
MATYNLTAAILAEAYPSLARQTIHYQIQPEVDARAPGFSDLNKGEEDAAQVSYRSIGLEGELQKNKAPNQLSFPNLKAVEVTASNVNSLIGLPVFMPIQFVGQNYLMLDREGNVRRVKMPTIYLPFSTLIEVTREKNIAKTQPNGVSGTNKEFWSFGDWAINLKGVMFDESHIYPQEVFDTLAQYENVCDAIEVVCPFLNRLGINRLVIDRFNTSQIKGMPNVIPFSMDCSSDNPQELVIEDAL